MQAKTIEDFTNKVIKLIRKIPKGKVATYGQIAELAGKPNGSRQVGFILRNHGKPSSGLPWQRVIGAGGRILFPKRNKKFRLQRRLLLEEGVHFDRDKIDLEKFRWKKRVVINGVRQPRMFSW
jgi:methylated-DNA-protein-cysteine methyltransferase related protein